VDVSIFDGWDRSRVDPRPASFDVLAIVSTYNEADVIGGLLGRLVSQGVRVHVIDNWSDDSTIEIVSAAALGEAVTFERFPADGAVAHYEWERLLGRVEEVAHGSGADWVIHHDADEIRESPWSGVDLAMGLWMVEQWGFNCVDHTVVNFRPIDGSWGSGGDLATAFAWCELGSSPGHFTQLKAWKPQVGRATLAARGGHEAAFEGRRVFPYKFVNRHYPIRSQAHGEQKIVRERHGRWSPEERARLAHPVRPLRRRLVFHLEHGGPLSMG
jgi:hypothetical protein